MVTARFAYAWLPTTDDVSAVLADEHDVLAWAQGQADGMLAADFSHVDVLDHAVEPVNETTALIQGSSPAAAGPARRSAVCAPPTS